MMPGVDWTLPGNRREVEILEKSQLPDERLKAMAGQGSEAAAEALRRRNERFIPFDLLSEPE